MLVTVAPPGTGPAAPGAPTPLPRPGAQLSPCPGSEQQRVARLLEFVGDGYR
jgi:hypothetical protein